MSFFWKIILLSIGYIITYFLFYILFILMVLLTILYIILKYIYPMIKRRMTPIGMRINHGMLKGYMTQKYGEKEGKSAYKQFVSVLRRKGYY